MRLAARERRGGAVERQVAEAERHQHLAARRDLGDEPLGDRPLALREHEAGRDLAHARERQPHQVGHRLAGHAHRQALGPQPRAATRAARLLGEVGAQVLERLAAAFGLLVAAGPGRGRAGSSPACAGTGTTPGKPWSSPNSSTSRACGRQLGDRRLEREAVALGHLEERLAQQPRPVPVPRPDGAVEDALRLVGDHARGVDHPALAEPVAGRAGAVRAVEGEGARGRARGSARRSARRRAPG